MRHVFTLFLSIGLVVAGFAAGVIWQRDYVHVSPRAAVAPNAATPSAPAPAAALSSETARREAEYQRSKQFGADLVYDFNRDAGATPAQAEKAALDASRQPPLQRKR